MADKIGEYAKLNGGAELLAKLKSDEFLSKSKDATEGLEDLEILFKYCSIFNLSNNVISNEYHMIYKVYRCLFVDLVRL